MGTNIELIQSKIIGLDQYDNLKRLISTWRLFNKKIVFTNGCFDIIHLGHIDYLAKAAEHGSVLVVGLNTDASIKRIKGPSRPINNVLARSMVLSSLWFVDLVVHFDQDTPYELIKIVQPDFLIKGNDYKPEEIVGYDIVKANNGQVITLDFLEGYSTTGILQKGLQK
ncbi:MAG TPA: D-glycero-beta-D-manno-heptose 1-phosphate adenylyltransferase [Bacteroidales bacterium]|nr:D-glycero-beta-D-manno-heptose 1-phosphate adenylyltransferase [Bacteroidales bacterium]